MTALQPLTHLVTQQTSGYRLGNEAVIRDQAAWAGAWQTILGGLPGGDPAPAVDFTRDMVVLVALGEANSGGITVHVDGVSHDGGTLLVRYTVTEPGEGCMTTQALTAPLDAVRVPRASGDVRFERRTVRNRC